MQSLKVILPCELSLLFGADSYGLVLVELDFFLGHVVVALLLKLGHLHRDAAAARPNLRLIEHLNGHVHGLQHCVADSRVTLRLLGHRVPVNLQLLRPCRRVQPKHTASHEVISELRLGDVLGESLDVDVVVDLGLEPLALLVFLIPLLL